MRRILFLIAAFAAALALLFRHYHHLSAFYTLAGVAVLALAFAVVGARGGPLSHFLEEMRRLAD